MWLENCYTLEFDNYQSVYSSITVAKLHLCRSYSRTYSWLRKWSLGLTAFSLCFFSRFVIAVCIVFFISRFCFCLFFSSPRNWGKRNVLCCESGNKWLSSCRIVVKIPRKERTYSQSLFTRSLYGLSEVDFWIILDRVTIRNWLSNQKICILYEVCLISCGSFFLSIAELDMIK